ncbi:acetate kinase [Candidatus Atribacteria bacterium RBG_19FT_COMBO_35_14]|uniref:Acetate kinase n=2 Tax=root TaxID=1 RepID=A0A1F5AA96_9BACT|nr:MAG: acetate kinase [Candidatus Atribacteria bacterium RBG_19FT_COMBO_35_14]
MKVLVVNSGSSSIKYQLFDMTDESVLAKGLVERIGISDSIINHYPSGREPVITHQDIPNHRVGIKLMIDALLHPDYGVIKDISEIVAVGHRVVHAGEKYSGSVLLTDEVMDALKECIELAPLHNPPNILGIEVCKELMPGVPQVGVFDTAFHQTIPECAYLYGIPYKFYKKYKVRRYGFHGTSHKFVAQRAAKILEKPLEELKIITCHLGNGSSITAVKNGVSVDTSLGFGTVAGIIMGTRCGDLDPAIIPFLMEKEKLNVEEINKIIYKESGFLGLSEGISSDKRDLRKMANQGNRRAIRTISAFTYGIKKYIGAYAAAMGGVDAIVFTAGIGENSQETRAESCEGLEFLGVKIDPEKNKVRAREAIISNNNSRVKVMVIPTNEELMIAKDTAEISANL